MPSIDQNFLGHYKAEDETQNLEHFFYTSYSYRRILTSDINFVCGRRGSGKTAIGIMLAKERDYAFSNMISRHDYYKNIVGQFTTRYAHSSYVADVDIVFEELWSFLIYISAMQAIVTEFDRGPNRFEKLVDNFKLIKHYLQENGYYKRDSFQILRHMLSKDLEASTEGGFRSINTFLKWIGFGGDFPDVKEYLLEVLHEYGKCLVVIDTLERYDINEGFRLRALQGLYSCVLEISKVPAKSVVEVKLFLPSEVYPYAIPDNPSKVETRLAFIHWRYWDLMKFVCRRLIYFLREKRNISLDESAVDWERNKDIKAKIWLKYMPERIRSLTGGNEDCFSYIIRHTHKKPREVLILLNHILALAQQDGSFPSRVKAEHVVKGVHQQLNLLIRENLRAFNDVCEKTEEIVRRSFTECRSILSEADIDGLLKNSRAIWRKANYSKEMVKCLLTQTGFLGVVDRERKKYVPSIGKTIFITRYEYQMKDRLFMNPVSEYAIHPIFFEDMSIHHDPGILIYPRPLPEEEELTEVGY